MGLFEAMERERPLICMLITRASCSLTGGEERELFVPKGENKVGLNDISPGKQYVFKVFAMSGRKQSKALQGKYPGKCTIFYADMTFLQFYANLPS